MVLTPPFFLLLPSRSGIIISTNTKSYPKKNTQKENKCVKALDETQKRFEEIFTAIGAVKAYIFDNDEFFMKNNVLLA